MRERTRLCINKGEGNGGCVGASREEEYCNGEVTYKFLSHSHIYLQPYFCLCLCYL